MSDDFDVAEGLKKMSEIQNSIADYFAEVGAVYSPLIGELEDLTNVYWEVDVCTIGWSSEDIEDPDQEEWTYSEGLVDIIRKGEYALINMHNCYGENVSGIFLLANERPGRYYEQEEGY